MVALHLIMLARQGYTLPSDMPKPLMAIIQEYEGSNKTNSNQNKSLDLINADDMKFDDKCKFLLNLINK